MYRRNRPARLKTSSSRRGKAPVFVQKNLKFRPDLEKKARLIAEGEGQGETRREPGAPRTGTASAVGKESENPTWDSRER